MSKPAAWTEDQRGEFRTAFRRDLRERATAEAWARMEEKLQGGVLEKECLLKAAHVGTHLAIATCQHYIKSAVTTLNLHDNLIMDLGAEALGQLLREAPSLLVLDVGNNDIGPAGVHAIAQAVETHKRMHTLILGSDGPTRTVNRCDAPTAKLLFEKCVGCRTLRTLHLNHVDIGSSEGGQEALLAAVPLITGGGANVAALHAIHLGHTGLSTGAAVRVIDAAKAGGSLITLDLHGNNLGPAAAEAMGNVLLEKSKRATVSNLRVLNFQQNPAINPTPIFAGLGKDKGVTTLNVARCNINDESLAVLCATLATNSVLTDVDVSYGRITAVGAVELARGLVRHPAMRRVVMSGNRIGDDGAAALAAVIEHARNIGGGAGGSGAGGANGTAAGSGANAAAAAASGGGGGGGGGAGSPSRSQGGAGGGAGGGDQGGGAGGALGLEELCVDECWISDRGAVALGVAIASNTSLVTLRMNNNHISGSAGTALAALLEKNRTLLTCSVVGNTLSHSTASAIERVIDRNRAIKADEGPGRLRQEICRLHYQLYKLEEAKAELLQQQKLRDKHAKAMESLENQLRSEEMEFRKKTKELRDAQRDAQISCESLETTMKSMAENFDRFVDENKTAVAAQEAKLKIEQAERAKAEEELERCQKEVAESVHLRQQRMDKLQEQIAEAHADNRLWLEQTALFREQLETAQSRAKELEAMGGSARSRRTDGSGGGGDSGRRRRSRRRAPKPKPDASAADDAALSFLEAADSARAEASQ